MSQPTHQSSLERSSQPAGQLKTSIDVAQWRQDVDAFAKATRLMLDSIHAELSNGLTTGEAQIEIVTNPLTISQSPNLSDLVQRDHLTPGHSPNSLENECDQLLANLKEQLSRQLAQ